MAQPDIRVIHLIEDFSRPHHGVIEAAVATSGALAEHGINSELWRPHSSNDHVPGLRTARDVPLGVEDLDQASRMAEKHRLDPGSTVVVSHGCWRWPTRFASRLRQLGFRWIYTPHGMLEPWSLRQKWLRKWVYWRLREGRFACGADIVRATSTPETANLEKRFSSVQCIPHGVPVEPIDPSAAAGSDGVTRILFMGRLHPKKGALALARAWSRSKLHRDDRFELVIVGQDDGELKPLQQLLDSTPSNIRRLEPIYDEAKLSLFRSCRFFALPSQSEGFPVALLEAMAAGLIPIISEGCNLPEAFENEIAIQVEPVEESIAHALNSILEISDERRESISLRARQFVKERYSVEAISAKLAVLYHSLLFNS